MKITLTPRHLLVALVVALALIYTAPSTRGAVTGYVIPNPVFTGWDNNGNPCTGCKLYSYLAGTTTLATTYSDAALTIANTNPIVLNSAGHNPAGGIYIADASVASYKFILKTAADVTIWTQDSVAVPSTVAPPAPAAVPTGAIMPFAGAAAPSGYLLCDGSLISRTTFSALFAAIATAYGVGDGSTTFGLPDLRGRFAFGKAVAGTGSTLGSAFGLIDHTHTSAAHTHTVAAHTHTFTTGAPSATNSAVQNGTGQTVGTATHTHSGTTDATALTTDSTTPGPTGTANPPGLTVNYIIKQ